MSADRIARLEEELAHQIRVSEDLSEVVTDQARRLEVLERRVRLLMERAAEDEAGKGGGVVIGSEKPPHY